MKIIFLDFDGVLNNTEYLKQQSEIVFDPFAPENVKNLNTITDATGARIVISSEWRRFGGKLSLPKLLEEHGVTGEVIGETPVLDGMPRGMEIQGWLLMWNKPEYVNLRVSRFVILDDRDDMGYIIDRLLLVVPERGLTEANAQQAIGMLNE